MKHPQFIMDSETVKRRIYETLRHGYFNDEKDYVDVSNGSGDVIEIVVVSRKFAGYTAGRRIDMILNELCKHLSQVEAGHVLFSIGMLPEEVYIL